MISFPFNSSVDCSNTNGIVQVKTDNKNGHSNRLALIVSTIFN